MQLSQFRWKLKLLSKIWSYFLKKKKKYTFISLTSSPTLSSSSPVDLSRLLLIRVQQTPNPQNPILAYKFQTPENASHPCKPLLSAHFPRLRVSPLLPISAATYLVVLSVICLVMDLFASSSTSSSTADASSLNLTQEPISSFTNLHWRTQVSRKGGSHPLVFQNFKSSL